MINLLQNIIIFIKSCLTTTALVTAKQNGDYVIILHGITRNSSHMISLAKAMENAGYDVINLDYPSTQYKIEWLVKFIQIKLTKKLTKQKPVHFVGHSMGGLVVRAILHKYNYPRLGRVVQLAPPNHGSEVADFFQDNALYKKIYGPAGQQLTTNKDLSHLFGEINYELGIIAGNNSKNPICSTIIPGDDDGKVSIKSTKLSGMTDHLIISASHTSLPKNKIVHQQTIYFLQNGAFNKKLRN